MHSENSSKMELTIEQILQKAIEAHKTGNLQDAETLYRAILHNQPNHPDANHNLGLLCVALNQVALAIPLFNKALKANKTKGQFWISYIDALIMENDLESAANTLAQGRKLGLAGEKVDALEAKLASINFISGSKASKKENFEISTNDIDNRPAIKDEKKDLSVNQTHSNFLKSPSPNELNALLKYCQLEQYDLAHDLATFITKKYPNHPFAWKALGTILQKTGKLNDACIVNQKVVNFSPNDPDAHYNLANTLKELGKLEEAQASYQKALVINPYDVEAYSNLGNTLQELGKLEEAQDSYQKALVIKPDFAEAHYNLGNTLQELGKLEEAQDSYQKALVIKPGFAQAHYSLANTLQKLGKLEEAQVSYQKALIIKPDNAEAFYNLGITLHELGKLEEAQVSYQKALVINPQYAEAYSNLGNALKELGKLEEAQANYQKALVIKPDFAKARYNLGITLHDLGKLEEAQASYQKALVIKPDYAEAYSNLGNTLKELGKLEEAQASYQKALVIKPDYAEAYSNLGSTLKELGKLEEAQASYQKALLINPNLAEAHYNLGLIYRECGLLEKTLSCLKSAIELNPHSIKFKWAFAICQIPKIYSSVDDIEICLDKFKLELNELNQFINFDKLDEAAEAAGIVLPYYLAYQEKNNKNFLTQYGELCCRIMKNWQNINSISSIHKSSKASFPRKIKIGIISSHIHYHSVWNSFLKGIVKNLNQQKFELHIFYLKNYVDEETKLARSLANSFTLGEKTLDYWAQKISASGLDIAFYPEIGMHPRTAQLAGMRIAPVQICSWGHPETSGLSTIDFYISSEFLECENSESNYTEKLIKLPGIGCYFEPPNLDSQEMNFFEMGLRDGATSLLCLGEPNKFSPRYDWVLIDIIKRLPNCQLIFMQDLYGASTILQRRLRDHLEKAGISFDKHILFLPPLSRQGFSALMKQSVALLDTIGISGFNTAMQAIGCGLPIITREGSFMRTRCASAILRILGLNELIAKSEKDYINLAEKVVLDQEFRSRIKAKILLNENLLYKDIGPVRALEDFFESTVLSEVLGH
jgi:tetratricopeptide (TPR) repeat protein